MIPVCEMITFDFEIQISPLVKLQVLDVLWEHRVIINPSKEALPLATH